MNWQWPLHENRGCTCDGNCLPFLLHVKIVASQFLHNEDTLFPRERKRHLSFRMRSGKSPSPLPPRTQKELARIHKCKIKPTKIARTVKFKNKHRYGISCMHRVLFSWIFSDAVFEVHRLKGITNAQLTTKFIINFIYSRMNSLPKSRHRSFRTYSRRDSCSMILLRRIWGECLREVRLIWKIAKMTQNSPQKVIAQPTFKRKSRNYNNPYEYIKTLYRANLYSTRLCPLCLAYISSHLATSYGSCNNNVLFSDHRYSFHLTCFHNITLLVFLQMHQLSRDK